MTRMAIFEESKTKWRILNSREKPALIPSEYGSLQSLGGSFLLYSSTAAELCGNHIITCTQLRDYTAPETALCSMFNLDQSEH